MNPPSIRTAALAAQLGCRLHGDPDVELRGIAGLGRAAASDLSLFIDARLAGLLATTAAGALLVADDFDARQLARSLPLLYSPHPTAAFAAAIRRLRPAWTPSPGIDPLASVHPSARLGAGCYLGPFAVVGANSIVGNDCAIHPHAVLYPNVRLGDRCVLHAHAVLREGTVLGDGVVLQPGVVLGGDGFGFYRTADGRQAKIDQVGIVQVESGVEIQANSCVDRATLDVTRIGGGTRIDSLVQVAHNCDIGPHVLLCAQVGLAGSTVVGEGAILAGQVGVAGHCHVGNGAIITAQSGTHGDLEPGKVYSGSPAFDHAAWLRSTAAFARLGDLQRQLREMRAKLASLAP